MNQTTKKTSNPVAAVKPVGHNGTQPLHGWCGKLTSAALAAAAWLTAVSAPAAQLIWDAGSNGTNTSNIAITGSGNWDTTTTVSNWNNGSGDTNWTQTSTTAALNGAIFSGPDAPPGTYQINLDAGQIAFTNLAIRNNGYFFYGSALYQPASDALSVSNGVSVTFSNIITGPNSAASWYVGAGGPAASAMSCLSGWSGMQLGIGSTNNSTVVYLGGNASGGVFFPNSNIIQTNGTMNYTATWNEGRAGQNLGGMPLAGSATWPASYTLNGPTAAITQAASLGMSRGGGSCTFNLINGTVTQTGAGHPLVGYDNSGNEHAGFYMQGGTMTIGTSSSASPLALLAGGAGANAMAVFSQSGGTIYSWGGVQIGTTAAGTPGANSLAAFTNSGGYLYLGNVGSVGITITAYSAATNLIDLTGGTVGALQSWLSAAPMTLDTLNGNITFQCADNNGSQNNITLSGALTGPGGFYQTGGGTLTLSGANNFAGGTVVSNGILYIKPILTPTNGSITLDGSAASPTMTVAPVSTGQFLDLNGNLTYATGTVTADFNFGALPPSSSVAPLQVTNNVVCTVTPNVTIEGSQIYAGTFPLIKYGGSVSGTLPTTPSALPASTSGYLTNIVAQKTIALVVTSSPISPSLIWSVASGAWDFSAVKNWKLFGALTSYSEPNAVQFDDSALNPLPVTITNDAMVQPSAITVLGTNTWTIMNKNGGSIAGSAALTKVGSSTLILTGTNTYAGGTVLEGGQLNINNGGDNSLLNSAIGTGPLTIDLGAKVDNTSGHSITLQPTIAENWVDDWTYVGSTNFNTGAGAITLGSSIVVLTVVSNTLEVDGAISDNGNNYKLEKAGNGALTLGADSSFTGGLQLDSGLLNLKSPNCLGNGAFIINGSATLDNLSGGDLTIGGITGSIAVPSATITYLGTSNMLSFPVQGNLAIGPAVFNVVSNTLSFNGVVCGNSQATKVGAGTLALAGIGTFIGNINQGELDLGAPSGASIGTGAGPYGLLVQSNAVAKITATANQFLPGGAPASYPVPAKLSSGGVLDLNGNSQTISQMLMTNGVLRTSLAATLCTLTLPTTPVGLAINLAGTNTFDVPDAAAELDISGNITGAGSLVTTGLGLVNLLGATNSYTGNTTVNGSLTINSEFLATNSTVTVNTNATLGTNGVLNLNFSDNGTNTVAALVLGGVSKPAGVYNATTDPLYLAGSGSLQVVPPPINPLPGTLQVNVSGRTLALSWPTNLGWLLQSQTNALNVGLLTNSSAWVNVLGSDQVTSTNITINPTNGAVFYRMVHP